MQVIARQHYNLTCANYKVFSIFVADPDTKPALDDIVIMDQVGCRAEIGRAVLGRQPCRHAPRREEIGTQEHATGQVRHPQDVG